MTSLSITGVGAVSGYGWGRERLWEGLAEGRSSAGDHTIDGIHALGARVPDPMEEPDDRLTRMERAVLFAAGEALGDGESRGWVRGSSVGVIHCTGIGDLVSMRDNYFRDANPLPSFFPHVLVTTPAVLVAVEHGLHGPNTVVNAACASANVAAIIARQWLDAGMASDVLITGAEFCFMREAIVGFRELRVLVDSGDPLDVCRPFQEGSRGFFLGEAAVAILVSRSGRPYADILGGAATHDAFHLTAIERHGAQVQRSFEEALRDADVPAAAVRYVNAHGTGTAGNDTVEAAVVDRVFPESTRLYSTKPLTGHCMAASAAVELAIAALSYDADVVPATCRVAAGNDRLLDGPTARRAGATLCSSIGLGGFNSALVINACS